MRDYLDFEKPIEELEDKLGKLKAVSKNDQAITEITKIEKKLKKVRTDIYANLTPMQKVKIARHKNRPTTSDYISMISTGFTELHGDRLFMDDPAIIGGIGKINGQSVVIIGHQKGTTLRDRTYRNFGMPNPEGYRKALRLMKLANDFRKPVVTLIDTPGAYPGIGAEERGQAEAIATNIYEMFQLSVPVYCVIIGEGGSGGALAIGVGDHAAMMEHSIYSVISPEGCAAILWNDTSQIEKAAETLKITSKDILELNVIDEIIPEPEGGAHLAPEEAGKRLKESIVNALNMLGKKSPEKLVEERYKKYRKMGFYRH